MDAVSSKTKRSMRVATLFTGVAACTAAMALGGTAQAATHTTVKHTPKGTRGTAGPAYRTSGNIREVTSCGSNTWLHVQSEPNRHSFCFGFAGTSVPTNEVGVYAQCGGNNYGWLDWPGGDDFVTYGPGSTYRKLNWAHLSYVHLSSWSSFNTTCYAVH
jgi:hypothetical protein